ncbi:MAG: hypothetical protein ACQEXJ_19815 [Myxococcota bacterium]
MPPIRLLVPAFLVLVGSAACDHGDGAMAPETSGDVATTQDVSADTPAGSDADATRPPQDVPADLGAPDAQGPDADAGAPDGSDPDAADVAEIDAVPDATDQDVLADVSDTADAADAADTLDIPDTLDAGGDGEVAEDVPPLPTEVLGLPLVEDGVLYAGAAAVDITPDPLADGPVYLAGFGDDRVAQGVRDPIWARAVVLARDGEYVAVVALDLVGVTGRRARLAAAALEAEGFAADRLIVHASHNHAGPDTVGMWGPSRSETGLNPAYQERLVDSIVEAVEAAAGSAVPVDLRTGSARVGDLSPYFTSPAHGGKGAGPHSMRGLIRDSRDPVVGDDTVTGLALVGPDEQVVASIAHVHTHVEVAGSVDLLTSDLAHAARLVLEDRVGGVGVVWVGHVGGLQTPLSVPMPKTDEDGHVRFEPCAPEDTGEACGEDGLRRDADGDRIPQWTSDDRWERTDHYGRLVGGLAADALAEAESQAAPTFEVRHTRFHTPIENRALEMAGLEQDPALIEPVEALVKEAVPEYEGAVAELKAALASAVLDYDEEDVVTGPLCPWQEAGEVTGCLPIDMWWLRLGDVELMTVPGELLPELALGLPDSEEVIDAAARGPGAPLFPQHSEACDEVDWSACRDEISVGDCDCRRYHAAPYDLAFEPHAPILSHLEAEHRLILGLSNEMGGYIIPAPDYLTVLVHPFEELLSLTRIMDVAEYLDTTMDHYEEAVSLGPTTATLVLEAAATLTAGE